MPTSDYFPSPTETLAAIREYFLSLDADRTQFREWLAGEVDGGPNNDGYYPLTDLSTNEFLVPCPKLLEAQIETEVLANISGKMSKTFATWAALEAEVSNPKQLMLVVGDAGTHVDPLTTAVVPNSGFYKGTEIDGDWTQLFALPVGSAAVLDADDDEEMTADSAELLATQRATKAHVAAAVAPTIKVQGSIDCSTNPMFPAATQGQAYLVSEAGLIGGALGQYVDQNTMLIAKNDNAGGNLVTAGPDWYIFGLPIQPGPGIDVAVNEAGNLVIVSINEVELTSMVEAIAAPVPYLVPVGYADAPTGDEVLLVHVFSTAVDFADEFAGAYGYVDSNPGATFTFDVERNGILVGTVVISVAGVHSFNTVGAGVISFVAGDVMVIRAQASVDATIANGGFTLPGTRL